MESLTLRSRAARWIQDPDGHCILSSSLFKGWMTFSVGKKAALSPDPWQADPSTIPQSINCPPLTSIVSPTIYEEASEARNAITFAHSRGVPKRASGIVVTKLRIISGVEKT